MRSFGLGFMRPSDNGVQFVEEAVDEVGDSSDQAIAKGNGGSDDGEGHFAVSSGAIGDAERAASAR